MCASPHQPPRQVFPVSALEHICADGKLTYGQLDHDLSSIGADCNSDLQLADHFVMASPNLQLGLITSRFNGAASTSPISATIESW